MRLDRPFSPPDGRSACAPHAPIVKQLVERDQSRWTNLPARQQVFIDNLYNETSFNRSGRLSATYTGQVNALTVYAGWSDRTFLRSGGRDRSLVGEIAYMRRLRPSLTLWLDGAYARTYESPLFGERQSQRLRGRLAYQINSTTEMEVTVGQSRSRATSPVRDTINESALSIGLRKRL